MDISFMQRGAAPTSCRGSNLDTRGGELSSLGEGRIGSILDAMQTWDIFGAVTKSCATVRRTKPRSNRRLVASGRRMANILDKAKNLDFLWRFDDRSRIAVMKLNRVALG